MTRLGREPEAEPNGLVSQDPVAAEEPASRPDDQMELFPVFDPKPRGAYGARTKAKRQLTELPGETWEDIFVCVIDESAGLKDAT